MKPYDNSFKDFPIIPDIPFWTGSLDNTNSDAPEKVMFNDQIGPDEENQLQIAIDFYSELTDRIKQTDLTELSVEEFEEFKKYYENAFLHLTFVQGDMYIKSMVRLVKNIDVQGSTDKIRSQDSLSYPSKKIVAEKQIYNRANTPNFNLFYSSLSIDSVLNELRPEPGEIVSAGIWEARNGIAALKMFPITHNATACKANPDVEKGYLAFEKIKEERHPLHAKLMEVMFNHLAYEFAKPVGNDQRNYYFSARFSEKVLQLNLDPQTYFDCMVYPSVKNEYIIDNLAILPDVIDSNFKLSKVIQFKVGQTYYDKRKADRLNQENITLLEPLELIETDWIESDGYIVWD